MPSTASLVRSVASIVSGYLATTLIVVMLRVATFRAFGMRLGDPPTPAYLAINVAISTVAAIVGGWLCAILAQTRPFLHVAILALLFVTAGLITARTRQPLHQPDWYVPTVAVLALAGSLFGGWLVMRSRRARSGLTA
jgi:hypothetical protein